MKKISLAFVVFFSILSNAQVNYPLFSNDSTNSGGISLSDFNTRYHLIKNSEDSSTYKLKKNVDRWYYENLSRMHIENDSTYSSAYYAKAIKSLVESNLFCNNDDIADWANVGPFDVTISNNRQGNGLVSAAYVHPSYPTEFFIGTPKGGIFKWYEAESEWRSVTDAMNLPVLGVRQITSSPFDPDFLIAVTGTESGLSPVQSGYLYSYDRGETWDYNEYSSLYDHYTSVFFDPGHSGLLFGTLSRHLLFSQDNGQNWSEANLPTELQNNYNDRNFDKVFVSGTKIFLVNGSGPRVAFWTGNIIEDQNNNFTIVWVEDLAPSLGLFDDELMVHDDHYTLHIGNQIFTQNYAYQDNATLNYYESGGVGCQYQSGVTYPAPNNEHMPGKEWHRIKTNGWNKETLNGVQNKLTCYNTNMYDNVTAYNGGQYPMEVIFFDVTNFDGNLYWQNTGEFEIGYEIPKGARVKLCVSPYTGTLYAPYTQHPTYYVCNIPDFDYDILFQNVLYETEFAESTQYVNDVEPINIPSSVISNAYVNGSTGMYRLRFYLIIEFNNDYEQAATPKFILNEFDIRPETYRPNLITVSNLVGSQNERFFVELRSRLGAIIYRTEDHGSNFDVMFQAPYSTSSTSPWEEQEFDDAKWDKEELIASHYDEDIFYRAVGVGPSAYPFKYVYDGISSSSATEFGNSGGHHDDYRSSCLIPLSGSDFILWGNDGGVAFTEDANASNPTVDPKNENLSINMIYNLDVYEESNNILIGLQDNGTRSFYPNQTNFEFQNDYDGSLAIIRNEHNNQYVLGDPQAFGDPIRDQPNLPPDAIVNDAFEALNLSGEVFLGMRSEEFRFDDERFIAGLQSKGPDLDASVIVNVSANVTSKVVVPNSRKIEAIAICQRQPNIVYAADARYKLDSEPKQKIFKSTDGGMTWPIPSPPAVIDPYVTFELNGSNTDEPLGQYLQWYHINALAVDHVDPDLLYAGISGVLVDNNGTPKNEFLRVIRSTDGGDSFQDWSQGLPALPINYLLTIESSNHLIFCATDAGVYYRMDNMSSWECFSKNLPKCRVTDLTYNYCTKELYCSTYGRGVWRTPVDIYLGTDVNMEITAHTTWNDEQKISENIVIKSGYSLYVNANVYMDADRKIIIEPNANLFIQNGAKITSRCGQMWDGIEVWGTSDERQLSTYQGTLTMSNGATIENAKEAVRLWKPGDWSSTGGIIRATNAIFHNNRRDVEFMPYQGVHFGINEANQSYFHYCQFITDDDFLRETPAPHVTMYMVNGVRFLACDFIDERDVEKERKSSGIYTIDAKFKILSKYTGTASIPNDYYQEQDFINSTFTNLQHGVWASNANSQNTVTIDRALFTNCEIGVELAQVDNAIVSRNKFLRDDNISNSDWYDYQHSVYLNTSSAFFVEGNIFESNNADSKMVGVTSNNTGLENNEIRRNKYFDVAVGNYAFGKNKNIPSPSETFKGLEYLCNKHGDNELYDVLVFGLQASDGVKIKQGVLEEPTGIAWSEPISGITLQATSNISQNTEFFYFDSQYEVLTLHSNTIVATESPDPNDCISHFNILKPRPTRPIDAGTASMLILLQDSLDTEISSNMERYLGFVQDGDREELYDLIATMDENNVASIKNTLLAESPFLSKELLMELARYCPDPFTYSWFLDVVLANIEIAKDEDFISFISNKPYAIPENMIDSLVQEALTGRTQKSDLLEEIMLMEAQRNNAINYRIKDEAHDTIPILAQQLDSLILQRNDFNKFIQLSDLFLMNKDKTNAERWLDSLDVLASNSLSPNREELNDYSAFKREMLLATNNNGYLEGLDSLTEAFIRSHLQTAGGISQVQAQNLLCFFFNECAEPPTVAIEKSISINNNLPFDEITSFTSSEISVYPNPARNAVVISLKEAETPIQVTFTNVKGEIVKRETMLAKHAEIDIRGLSDGFYTITLEDKSGKLYSGKLLKQ